jgi:hypothetical protein
MRPFDPRLSLYLDRALLRAEQGSRLWRIVKRLIEWHVFGGKP